jgi:DNA (cytosine-5)-methyltransferase 1
MKQLTHGSLFAGIGGFDLGFERAGIKTVWQVEIDPFCRKVLERHFPNAERFEDVRAVGVVNLKRVDIICGGFPCQDISNAGYKVGIAGKRSGLWSEMCRIISELRPQFAVVENVAALLGRGMGRVLGDLAEIGYDAEWETIPAAHVGLPHLRERIWILAYPYKQRLEAVASKAVLCSQTACRWNDGHTVAMGGAEVFRHSPHGGTLVAESVLVGNRNGVPDRVDRIRSLGNAVVPQIAEWIGGRIVEAATLNVGNRE